MGATQSLEASTNDDIVDAFELVEFNQKINIATDKVKICDVSSRVPTPNFSEASDDSYSEQKLSNHGDYDDYEDSVPDFKEQNRRRREKKIYRKHNKYIIKYNITEINQEVESRLHQIIHMRSFNELESYIRSFILHNKTVMLYDNRKN